MKTNQSFYYCLKGTIAFLFIIPFTVGLTSCTNEDMPVPSEEQSYLSLLQSLNWGTDTCYVYGHKTPDVDAVSSALAYAKLMRTLGYNCKAKVPNSMNKETEYIAREFGFALPEIKPSVDPQTRLIITDHNEYIQSVDGVKDAIILQKIDHHDGGDMLDSNIPYVRREIVGSCSTIVYQCYQDAGVPVDDETARILLAGILSDTHNLSKVATCPIDSIVLYTLANQLGIGPDSLSTLNRMMSGAKYDFEGMTDADIFNSDIKEYTINGFHIAIASLDFRLPGMEEFLDRMLAVMPTLLAENQYDMIFAKVDEHIPNTGENKELDPYIEGGTYFIYYGGDSKTVAEAVFGPSLSQGVTFSEEKMGRKVIVNLVTEVLNGLK